MNKYENAIDKVARYCSDYKIGINPPRNELSNELDILMELVGKETPKKVKGMEDYYYPLSHEYNFTGGQCPNCNEYLSRNEHYRPKYCCKCGQRLDWSE